MTLTFKTSTATVTVNEAFSAHIHHLRHPTVGLKYLCFSPFKIIFHSLYPWYLVIAGFFFLFSILSYVVLIIVLLFIKYFECDKSTENNINIMNTHVPGYQELNILPHLLQIFLQKFVTADIHWVPLSHLLPSPETATHLVLTPMYFIIFLNTY